MYRWVDHTAEVEVLIEAPTEAAVFADALAAFAELVGDGNGAAAERREIEVEADDREALLAEWLNELVFLADVEQFVPERVNNLVLEEGRLHASVRGHLGEPRPIVKAITRHGLELRRSEEGWLARVVFDV